MCERPPSRTEIPDRAVAVPSGGTDRKARLANPSSVVHVRAGESGAGCACTEHAGARLPAIPGKMRAARTVPGAISREEKKR